MKRSSWEGPVQVCRYGVQRQWDLPQEAIGQLRLAHELRNKLVEIDKALDERREALWADHPEVGRLVEALERADRRVEEALEAVAEAKKQSRSQKVPAGLKADLAEARKARKETAGEAKQAKAAARDAMKPAWHALDAERQEKVKGLYGEFGLSGRGLFWGTHNAVVASHDTARQRIFAARKDGQPAELKFARWRGEGTLTFQVMRQSGDPLRTPALLSGDEKHKWRNVLRVPALPENFAELSRPEQTRAGRVTLSVKLKPGEDKRPVWLDIPIVMHRPLPADGDISQVQVSRRVVAGKPEVSVAVTVRLPTADLLEERSGPAVAFNFGWRRNDDGTIRIGTWMADRPLVQLPAQPELSRWVRPSASGVTGEIVVPSSWQDTLGETEKLAGIRDDNHNTARADLLAAIKDDPQIAERCGLDPKSVRQWRNPAHLAKLTLVHRADPEPIWSRLEAWRRQDRHLWDWHANLTRSLSAERADVARKFADWIVGQAGVVVTDDTNLARLARRPQVDQGDDPGSQAARHARRMAAPGLWRQAVRNKAAGRNVPAQVLDASWVTRTHADCGTQIDSDEASQGGRWIRGPACDRHVDRDINACANLLLRHHNPNDGD